MGISTDEWKQLTESKFWRPEIGTQTNVVLTGWRFARQAFKQDPNKLPTEEELRPTLVADIVSINGQPQQPAKVFTSSNKALNKQLMECILRAEQNGLAYVRLAISRPEKQTYGVVDLALVDGALRGVPTSRPPRGMQPYPEQRKVFTGVKQPLDELGNYAEDIDLSR